MERSNLVIRADATGPIGAGHVMRMLVLADVWRSGIAGNVTLVGDVDIPFVRARVRSSGLELA